MPELSKNIGSDNMAYQTFHTCLSMLIEHVVSVGCRDSRAPWREFRKSLVFEESHELSVLRPDEELAPWAEYVDEHGGPATSGLGHREA